MVSADAPERKSHHGGDVAAGALENDPGKPPTARSSWTGIAAPVNDDEGWRLARSVFGMSNEKLESIDVNKALFVKVAAGGC